ncbi:histidine phosphatase family protein [Brevibacillus sp. SYSU BS000544]|uniref:histidine phosphatase family protein n=1 Tax=Brevibacillus sp. SYSU BS000544 TaxID=3416443 RepID=UPI003CE53C65
MDTILYFIRHGETEWNKLRRIQGHSDIDLNALGTAQAEKLAAHLANHPFAAVYSSDLKRAHTTAQKIVQQTGRPLPHQTFQELRERCYGEWEGLTYEEIRAKFTEPVSDEKVYGIEAFEAMQIRANECLTKLAQKHPNEMIAVVSHGGLINAFLHYVTGGEQGTGITRIDNTSVSVFRFQTNSWEVLHVNDTTHLIE